MNKNSFIYLRGLKHAENAVFCVENGQKSYYDPQFGFQVPYASGQQVKRSILSTLVEELEGIAESMTDCTLTIYDVTNGEATLHGGE